jgi:hypothetical protein
MWQRHPAAAPSLRGESSFRRRQEEFGKATRRPFQGCSKAPWVEQKKRSVGASEREEFVRAAWRSLVAREIHAERLVFVDEMGANISLAPVYAWSRRGERAFVSVPRNWGKNVTPCWRA